VRLLLLWLGGIALRLTMLAVPPLIPPTNTSTADAALNGAIPNTARAKRSERKSG